MWVAVALVIAGNARAQLVQLRHWSGQGVAPVYEGYDVNPDGSYNMWFGYMNRNYEEELDIPVGPDNRFEPGGDHGQPTHFAIRRHKDVFKVTVPRDFGDEQVTGSLKPVWMIDRLRTTRGGNSERINSNTPPVVTVEPAQRTIALADAGAVALAVSAADDGLPQRNGQPVGMTASWARYRGPGEVTFHPAQVKLVDGRASVTASFSAPGEYTLQVVVDDGSGELAGNFGYHCCWTNAQVRITVQGGDNGK
jgi:hypothetical protein